ncbi:MAG: hypothetical protein AAGF12_06035 [Myxococcota bacterium]
MTKLILRSGALVILVLGNASAASAQCTTDADCSGDTPFCNESLTQCVPGVPSYTEHYCSDDATFGGTDGWRNNLGVDDTWTTDESGGVSSYRDEGGDWAAPLDRGENFLVVGGGGASDYEISVQVSNDDDDGVGLVARYAGVGSYYVCFYNNDATPGCGTTPDDEFKILEVDSTTCPGGARPFQRAATSFTADTTGTTVYTMTLRVVGGEVSCSLTGGGTNLNLSFTDATPRPAGEYGLYAYDNGLQEGGTAVDPAGAEVFDNFTYRSLEPDTDRDGLSDTIEATIGTSPTDPDTDRDGLTDGFELGPDFVTPLDTDADGLINPLDRDSDGDGRLDGEELRVTPFVPPGFGDNTPCVRAHLDPTIGSTDKDSDGVPDETDADSDNDGIPDSVEVAGFAGDPDADADGDGVPNWNDPDSVVGGCTSDGGNPALCTASSLPAAVDADGDGIPNHHDLDSDDDGITDALEAGLADNNGNGNPDACTAVNAMGICNAGGLPGMLPNTDGAGPADPYDPDSDGDGLPDSVEAFDLNGNGVIAGAEPAPTGRDTDFDGIDDAFDPDIAGSTPVTPPFNAVEDSDGNGTPDWLETCVDGYVRGTEACDDGDANNTNACNNMCLRNVGQPCGMGTQCASMICNATTNTCAVCDDTVTGGVDQGCMAAMPACVVNGGVPTCAVCEDSAMGMGMDDGCGAAAPFCNPTSNTCVTCVDSGTGVQDIGCTMANPVCDPTAMGGAGACVTCENDDAGTGAGDVDFGCGAGGAGPFCDVIGGAPTCVDCVINANCNDGNACTADSCNVTGSCVNSNQPAGRACNAGTDACDGAGTCVDCVNNGAGMAADAGCRGAEPFCMAAMGAAGMCVECLTTADCPAMEFCNGAGACQPGCTNDSQCPMGICDEPNMVCVTCINDQAMGMDDGCMVPTAICAGAAGIGMAGTECVECTDADTSLCNAGEVCDSMNTCTVCVDDMAGTMTDTGCNAITPICDTTGANPVCVGCLTDADCPGSSTCEMNRCSSPDTDMDGVPDDMDIDDDNDGIPDTVETSGVDFSMDTDGDGVPDYADPDVVTCEDVGNDGVCDRLPENVDLDGDGVPNHLDLDADADGLPDATEGHDANADGTPDVVPAAAFVDTDGDGLQDAYDADNGGTAAPTPDFDGDTRPDFLDGDADDDGLPDHLEASDANGDGRQDTFPLGIDVDGNGIDDAFDPAQGGAFAPGQDTDGDGRPNYLDIDSDGDGIREQTECPDPTACSDANGDGVPDYLDLDSDSDGIVDAIEGHDANADGVPDRMPEGADADNDGLDDAFDPDSGGVLAPVPDTDADGIFDFRDVDDDNDGVQSRSECPASMACPDADADGTPDYLDADGGPTDTDGDGISDADECEGDIANCRDSDGDGTTNDMDPDDDGDGIPTAVECAPGGCDTDTDGDGRPDYLDIDSDNDGILDAVECPMSAACADTDLDGVPDFRELDADDDGIDDATEGHDANMDGVADRTPAGADSDGDGLDDAYDPDNGGTAAPVQDTDADTIPDYQDVDDDADGIATSLECLVPATCPDADGDMMPDYLDADAPPIDTDMDGIPDVVECPPPGAPGNPASCPDTDGDGMPNFNDPDDDNDGIPTASENYDADGDPSDDDTDRDGIPDYLDADDDNDGTPTAMECVDFAAGCADADMDGIADYLQVCGDGRTTTWDTVTSWEECDDANAILGDGCDNSCRLESDDPDDDMDGLSNSTECPPPGDWRNDPTNCPDSDGDGMPDFQDPDDDNDTIPTVDELGPMMMPMDTDMDGMSNHLDPDDDNDTIPTAQEVREGRALATPSDDVDNDGRPNWLDEDSDADGIPDMDEPGDSDGNGVPDYLEPSPNTPPTGGYSGGALCSAGPLGSPGLPTVLLGFAALLFFIRRRR